MTTTRSSSKQGGADSSESFSFCVGKLDAGIAVLLSEQSHLIEFPSILLPPGCQPGSFVSISCSRDHQLEKQRLDEFWQLQDNIVHTYGRKTPQPPQLRLRNVTQTSVTLEWDPLDLATAKLLSLTIYRNGQRLSNIPNPQTTTSTKLSGLDLSADYTFQLVLKTTAGAYNSQQLKVKTHSIAETSGIRVCFGIVQPPELLEQTKQALQSIGAKWSDKVQIETTHLVCTSPSPGASSSGSLGHGKTTSSTSDEHNPSVQYQRALQMSLPTVLPSWVLACATEKKMVPIASHYLGSGAPQPSTSSASIARTPATSSLPTVAIHPAPADSPVNTEPVTRAAEPEPAIADATATSPNIDEDAPGVASPEVTQVSEEMEQVDLKDT
ncbi:uncharacterized protein L969DRAFT_42979 [Mixia osmundae IAM 14324]|uniref:Fibronectin type-III domain-containing protein n=1 Tax=Mixia osmundae (strain CBS 9802 / IAM 14324 / JCM 22182 / KY 12970) TaxID=764103 RepID=G7E3Y5_MIXOS|nr:uncharacterized protein L969DRAFT_42979 [Mixia osmundae IAM 14324]KEI41991.1 hypothetical protein L969DRAFT_42979 [Mixia osmundae IAM 14324]GAA97545.1 hypothetical protein E5Q_04223 [Mixia osmundae IAM 14324]